MHRQLTRVRAAHARLHATTWIGIRYLPYQALPSSSSHPTPPTEHKHAACLHQGKVIRNEEIPCCTCSTHSSSPRIDLPTAHRPARLPLRSDGPTPRLRSYANVYSWFQPDTIVHTSIGGEPYLVMANEGDSKEEALRVKALKLDPVAFPNAAALQAVGRWPCDEDTPTLVRRMTRAWRCVPACADCFMRCLARAGTNYLFTSSCAWFATAPQDNELGRLTVDPLSGVKGGYNTSESYNTQAAYSALYAYGARSWSIISAKTGACCVGGRSEARALASGRRGSLLRLSTYVVFKWISNKAMDGHLVPPALAPGLYGRPVRVRERG